MSNILIAGIYIPLTIASLIVLIQVLLQNTEQNDKHIFIILCLLVVGWFGSDIAGILTKSEDSAKFFWNFSLIFVGFIPPVLLLFVLDFYRVTLNRAAKFIPLIFVIPSVNTIIALTSKYHSLIHTQLDIVSLSPIHEVVRVWGPWFWVHTAYCYVVTIIIIIVILTQHFRLPKFYRMPSTLMTIGISFTLIGNVVTLLNVLPVSFDPTLIGTSIALIFFNYAIINNDWSRYVRYSFGKVFNYLNLYILVIDKSNRVLHVNRPALDWFSSRGVVLQSAGLDEIIESLIEKGGIKKDSESEEGVDFYFPADPFPVVLNMQIHNMTDTNEDIIGSVAVFTDVTQNRLLLDRLEEKAGMDSLTGIANHMAYEGAKKRFNTPEHLPLSVIMCDVNGLKEVNDNFGHKYGDMMLQEVAGVFEAVCPRTGFTARIGGDEFIFLLSNTSFEDAIDLSEKIRVALASRVNLPFALSVALGVATKKSDSEELSDVVELADSRMYENKRWMKALLNN